MARASGDSREGRGHKLKPWLVFSKLAQELSGGPDIAMENPRAQGWGRGARRGAGPTQSVKGERRSQPRSRGEPGPASAWRRPPDTMWPPPGVKAIQGSSPPRCLLSELQDICLKERGM